MKKLLFLPLLVLSAPFTLTFAVIVIASIMALILWIMVLGVLFSPALVVFAFVAHHLEGQMSMEQHLSRMEEPPPSGPLP